MKKLETRCYRGRFAPSPSGPLHLGSVVTALASYLQARHHAGEWHVRIDNLDRPRSVPGASARILAELERLGFEWDGAVVYQSAHDADYALAATALEGAGWAFPCGCTRREAGTGPYPGTCRNGLAPGRRARALRVHAHRAGPVSLEDAIQGRTVVCLGATLGDFIVRRADGIVGYQLAAVVDDHALGATEVVRGADLLQSSAAQAFLCDLLEFERTPYAHVPVAVDLHGTKLSKANRAPPSEAFDAIEVLVHCLEFLGQDTEGLSTAVSARELLHGASQRWSLSRVPRGFSARAPDVETKHRRVRGQAPGVPGTGASDPPAPKAP